MKKITCIFFGRSGSGKGTQATLLIEKLKTLDPEGKTIYLETGERFRNFIKTNTSYIADRVREVLHSGGLLPAFLPIWIWTQLLVDELQKDEHLVLDGLSRRGEEAPILDSAIQFLKREGTVIFLLDTSEPEAMKRLIARGRHDDTHEKILERFKWFETDVMKAVKYFEKNSYYKFCRINGDQSIEAVQNDISKALGI